MTHQMSVEEFLIMAIDKLRPFEGLPNAKDMAVDCVLGGVTDVMRALHPVDKVDALRSIAGRCDAAADAAQDYNEQHGVPERAEDQE